MSHAMLRSVIWCSDKEFAGTLEIPTNNYLFFFIVNHLDLFVGKNPRGKVFLFKSTRALSSNRHFIIPFTSREMNCLVFSSDSLKNCFWTFSCGLKWSCLGLAILWSKVMPLRNQYFVLREEILQKSKELEYFLCKRFPFEVTVYINSGFIWT